MPQNHQQFIANLVKNGSTLTKKDYKSQVNDTAQVLDYKVRYELSQLNIMAFFEGGEVFKKFKQDSSRIFSLISARVTHDVLQAKSIEDAAKIYAFWVDVAIVSGVEGNFELENAIVSGLLNNFIDRIFDKEKAGYGYLPDRTKKNFEVLKDKNRYSGASLTHQSDYLIPFSTYFKSLEYAGQYEKKEDETILDSIIEMRLLGNMFYMHLGILSNKHGITQDPWVDNLFDGLDIKYFDLSNDDRYEANLEISNGIRSQAVESKPVKTQEKFNAIKVEKIKRSSQAQQKFELGLAKVYYEAFHLKMLIDNKMVPVVNKLNELRLDIRFVSLMQNQQLRATFIQQSGLGAAGISLDRFIEPQYENREMPSLKNEEKKDEKTKRWGKKEKLPTKEEEASSPMTFFEFIQEQPCSSSSSTTPRKGLKTPRIKRLSLLFSEETQISNSASEQISISTLHEIKTT